MTSRLQPGCQLPNSTRTGIIKLFPAREGLVSDIPAGDGKTANLFLQCSFWIAAPNLWMKKYSVADALTPFVIELVLCTCTCATLNPVIRITIRIFKLKSINKRPYAAGGAFEKNPAKIGAILPIIYRLFTQNPCFYITPLCKKGLLNCTLDRIIQNNDSATHYSQKYHR